MINRIKPIIANSVITHQLKLFAFRQRSQAMLGELSKVPIVKSGVETISGKTIPFVVLNDDIILFGMYPTEFEKRVFHKWMDRINPNINEEAVRLAMDVILRYQYPHAMPHLTMPYSRRQRTCFHPQHIETISDLPNLTMDQKRSLLEVFMPKRGESFLDAGAYIGFGVVRMARELGAQSKVIAVESDPEASFLLDINVKANNLSNVVIVSKSISDQDGFASFHKTERQANSLIAGMVDAESTIRVPSTTIDTLMKELGVDSLDRASITINGAELEAVNGMKTTLERSQRLKISIAGWYKRNGRRICDTLSLILQGYGYNVATGQKGALFAWKS